MKLSTAILAGAVSLTVALSASAHTSFLRPNAFDVTHGEVITLTSGFTEDFSNPEVGVKSQDWHYIGPDGVRVEYDNVVELNQITVLEGTVKGEGTYRFSTGERLGRQGKMIRSADGTYKPATDEKRQPVEPGEGETLITSQTATVADVYVSKGAPTQTVLRTRIGRLAFIPVTHPNELYVDEAFELDIRFDDAALANKTLFLSKEGASYSDARGEAEVTTDENGRLSLALEEAGVYLLMTRHKADAPAGADTEIRSYTTSLTFEVTK